MNPLLRPSLLAHYFNHSAHAATGPPPGQFLLNGAGQVAKEFLHEDVPGRRGVHHWGDARDGWELDSSDRNTREQPVCMTRSLYIQNASILQNLECTYSRSEGFSRLKLRFGQDLQIPKEIQEYYAALGVIGHFD